MGRKRTALVTGASSGIGEAIAKQLLADGFIVYGAARRVEKMTGLKEQGVITLKMDVTKDDDMASAVAAIQKDHGELTFS